MFDYSIFKQRTNIKLKSGSILNRIHCEEILLMNFSNETFNRNLIQTTLILAYQPS